MAPSRCRDGLKYKPQCLPRSGENSSTEFSSAGGPFQYAKASNPRPGGNQRSIIIAPAPARASAGNDE
jgi:hypothetical protein